MREDKAMQVQGVAQVRTCQRRGVYHSSNEKAQHQFYVSFPNK